MVVSMELEVTAEELFNLVLDSVVADVSASTGKKPENVNLRQGFSYKKDLTTRGGRRESAKVVLEQLEPPFAYIARIESKRGTYRMSYKIAELGEGRVSVTYEETHEDPDARPFDVAAKFGKFLFERSARTRARNTLRQMGQYIEEHRE